MKKIIAFLFISSLAFVTSTSCDTRQKKCADGNTKDSTYCHLYGKEGTGVFSAFTELYRACPKGQKCVNVNGIGQCLQKTPLYAIGEACKVHSECQSGNCKDKIEKNELYLMNRLINMGLVYETELTDTDLKSYRFLKLTKRGGRFVENALHSFRDFGDVFIGE